MLTITAPEVDALDGRRLREELAAAGLVIAGSDMYYSGGDLVFPTLADSDKAAVQLALSRHMSRPALPDPAMELAAAVSAVDTSRIADVATRAVIDALKAALSGNRKPRP